MGEFVAHIRFHHEPRQTAALHHGGGEGSIAQEGWSTTQYDVTTKESAMRSIGVIVK